MVEQVEVTVGFLLRSKYLISIHVCGQCCTKGMSNVNREGKYNLSLQILCKQGKEE